MARVVAVGLPHHITQRGNGRRDVFLSDTLRRTYLKLLREQAEHYRLRILAYCLMTNHVHLIAIPDTEHSLACALRHAHGRFALFWNAMQSGVGHMWQNRYYSCPMQPCRVWQVIRYVELNPVRAGLIPNAAAYPWSSAAAHVTGSDPAGLLDMRWWHSEWTEGNWAEALRMGNEESARDAIRRATYSGRPLGDDDFLAELETKLGRKLSLRTVGRPKKSEGGRPTAGAQTQLPISIAHTGC